MILYIYNGFNKFLDVTQMLVFFPETIMFHAVSFFVLKNQRSFYCLRLQ